MKLKHLSVIAVSLLAANAMACYTVYDRSGRVAYQGEQPPVDMSLQLREALQARFPGGHMVFEQNASCQPISLAQISRSTGPAAPANTAIMGAGANRKVAVATASPMRPAMASSGPPNTAMMGAGPAMPQEQTVAVASTPVSRSSSPMLTDIRTAQSMNLPYTVLSGGIVVVPAQAAARVDMPSMTVVPSGVTTSRAPAANDTVITELHNPPLTVTQRGGDMMISQQRY